MGDLEHLTIPYKSLEFREVNGFGVSLLSGNTKDGNSLLVTVVDEKDAGRCFTLEVRAGEDPHQVFLHPFAYRAVHQPSEDTKRVYDEVAARMAAIDQEEAATSILEWEYHKRLAEAALKLSEAA